MEKLLEVINDIFCTYICYVVYRCKLCYAKLKEEDMVRPKSANQFAFPNYVACAPRSYKGILESLTRRMIPFADLIQITHLKIQQCGSKQEGYAK